MMRICVIDKGSRTSIIPEVFQEFEISQKENESKTRDSEWQFWAADFVNEKDELLRMDRSWWLALI